MSNKQRKSRNVTPPEPQKVSRGPRGIFIGAFAALAVLAVVAWVTTGGASAKLSDAELAALQRPHAATKGNATAPVHIVEFLDPACETCREFYPYVKRLMKNHPGQVKLSVRMVAFHANSDLAVKALEASKAQGKFWEVLESLLASQNRWVIQHRVDPERLRAQLQTLDLDLARLQTDMESARVLQNISLDAQDAKTMKVRATPEYFVNGRGLSEFGYEQLEWLVSSEVAKTR
jgi:protein-disulfide isomerase